VVVDQYERIPGGEFTVGGEDRGVLVRLAQRANVQFVNRLPVFLDGGHRRLPSSFYNRWLCKLYGMTYVIAQPCVDVLDRGCVDECPVDCIYEGERALYIHPDECVDCGACEPVCPVEAIYYEDDLPGVFEPYLADNAVFFSEVLSGRDSPLGSPGGASRLGAVGADTPLVASLEPQGG